MISSVSLALYMQNLIGIVCGNTFVLNKMRLFVPKSCVAKSVCTHTNTVKFPQENAITPCTIPITYQLKKRMHKIAKLTCELSTTKTNISVKFFLN